MTDLLCRGCNHFGVLFGAMGICARPIEGHPDVCLMLPGSNVEDTQRTDECIQNGWKEEEAQP